MANLVPLLSEQRGESSVEKIQKKRKKKERRLPRNENRRISNFKARDPEGKRRD